MKAFMYDQHYGYLLAETEVADANNLPPYTTTVAPDPTKSYQKFNGTEWVGGMDDATFQQQVAVSIAQQQANIKPSESAQAMNTLGLQVASLTAENKQLKQSINQLGLQLAQLTMKDKKENGGN
ncbi:hypothetical protein [Limosilactobacillus portuensis]|uniref:hypothetical protein n=1 Tax=Limosilactobacillus portuensis TaxID=2742601 RepID=UPI002358C845|nr:hypothetical protein [Limosilactobacillus portuensis]WCT60173.1 hypothetical protein PRK60_06255 [Limosilactobacillus portuensis]